MPKNEIDLSGIDFSDLNLPRNIRLPNKRYRTFKWADLTALKKKLNRWEILREKEAQRMSIIDAEIEKLKRRIEELKNTEFSQE